MKNNCHKIRLFLKFNRYSNKNPIPLQVTLMTFTASFDTGLHADCASFVPNLQESSEEIAVISCYELEEVSNKRLGKLILAERVGNEVKVVQEVTGIPGVFEFTWFPGTNILVTALAEGVPKLYKYDNSNKELVPVVIKCEENDLEMTLAVSGGLDCFLTCDNKGYLRQWCLLTDKMEIKRIWMAHDAEIWYVSQDLHDSNLFYTGSDDCTMKIWDTRSESSVAVNKSGHKAGVCCIKSSPWDEFVIASGSYDEKVRFWDRRMMRSPLKSIECGSGTWRVTWNPKERNLMGVAAMRAGFHVVNSETVEILQTESVNDHVAYGIDWHPNGNSLVSCSFYNNQGQFFNFSE